eukprot:6488501-Amphidinium_carterae.1
MASGRNLEAEYAAQLEAAEQDEATPEAAENEPEAADDDPEVAGQGKGGKGRGKGGGRPSGRHSWTQSNSTRSQEEGSP